MDRGLGDRLYALVEQYAALGDHRTGTSTDERTVDWFAGQLRGLGASVELLPYGFDRYDVTWSVRVDGEEVTSLPLFYEGTGTVVTDRPATATVQVVAGSRVPELEEVRARARAEDREAVVLATDAGTGLLCAVNRAIGPPAGVPTVCVPGALGARLDTAEVEVDVSAELVPGRSAVVVAALGEGPTGSTVLVTTPLSGWFRCAGERGTGIAVTLEVARRLAEDGPVLVAGTTGHELMGAGQDHLLAHLPVRPAGILHVGASAAAGEGVPLRLATTRWAGGWVGAARRDELACHVERLGARPILPETAAEAARPESWLGEARGWAPLGVPLLSIAGGFPMFHAPEDLPAVATTPALLAHVAGALSDAARLLRP